MRNNYSIMRTVYREPSWVASHPISFVAGERTTSLSYGFSREFDVKKTTGKAHALLGLKIAGDNNRLVFICHSQKREGPQGIANTQPHLDKLHTKFTWQQAPCGNLKLFLLVGYNLFNIPENPIKAIDAAVKVIGVIIGCQGVLFPVKGEFSFCNTIAITADRSTEKRVQLGFASRGFFKVCLGDAHFHVTVRLGFIALEGKGGTGQNE